MVPCDYAQNTITIYIYMFHCVYIDKDRIQIWKYGVYLFSESGVSFTFPTVVFYSLTHWGRVTHICVVKMTIIGSDNGLSPGRRQAIIWTNAGILLIGPLETNFIESLIGIQTFSFKKMHLKMSSAKWCPFCLGLNVLNIKLHLVLWQWIRILKMQPSLGKQRDKTTSAECDSAINNTIS